jgi:CRP/FNR family transcriptional regulator
MFFASHFDTVFTEKWGNSQRLSFRGEIMDVAPEIRVRASANSGQMWLENPLSSDEQDTLRRMAKVIAVKPRTILYSQAEAANFVYLVAEGIIQINRCDESGHRQVLVFRVAGDFCGIPHDGFYFNSAESISDTVVYRFEWRKMLDLFRVEPHLQSILLGKILNDYRQAQTRISILGQQNIGQRLASFLLDLIQIPQFFEEDTQCLSLPVNRFDLADYLGTAPESIARAFAKLENLGLLRRVTARSIAILDVSGLRSLHRSPRRSNGLDKALSRNGQESAVRTDFEPAEACK